MARMTAVRGALPSGRCPAGWAFECTRMVQRSLCVCVRFDNTPFQTVCKVCANQHGVLPWFLGGIFLVPLLCRSVLEK